jgi:hypothetical protein
MIRVSDQAFISKWWWRGAIRSTRLPNHLKLSTWTMTESASTTKIPPIRRSSGSVFVMIAKAASEPPSPIEPVSPMKTCAGKALYQRNPIEAPIRLAPRMARSRSSMSAGPPWRTADRAATSVIAVYVSRAMVVVPAARPSIPSVRFTPFEAPAMMKKRRTYHPQESGRSMSRMGR